jgi:hypothetical protein
MNQHLPLKKNRLVMTRRKGILGKTEIKMNILLTFGTKKREIFCLD